MRADPATRLHRDEPLDLMHLGIDRVIGSYLVETTDGLALHDCGPAATLPALERALAQAGVAWQDIAHLLISHIHLDHAGAAGSIVSRHPHIQVHVSALGAPHMVRPEKLEASSRRVFGAAFDQLWGHLEPVPQANIRIVGDDVLGLACFASPGHAIHQVCYLAGDGTLLTGDAAGVRIAPYASVYPAAPPPDIDIDAWLATLDAIERARPERLALTHFGLTDDPAGHLARMRDELTTWAAMVRDGLDVEQFTERVHARMRAAGDGEGLSRYDQTAPPWMSHAGIRRYFDKRGELPAEAATASSEQAGS